MDLVIAIVNNNVKTSG